MVGTFAGPRLVAGALAAATGLAVGWGLLGKAIPPLDTLGDSTGRMTGTVGYWNAFALIAAWGFPLGLWLATRSRLAGLLLIYASTVALLLTFSRGGLVVAAAAVGLWLLLARERTATLATLAIGALPASRRLAGRVRAAGRLEGQPAAARARPRRTVSTPRRCSSGAAVVDRRLVVAAAATR